MNVAGNDNKIVPFTLAVLHIEGQCFVLPFEYGCSTLQLLFLCTMYKYLPTYFITYSNSCQIFADFNSFSAAITGNQCGKQLMQLLSYF